MGKALFRRDAPRRGRRSAADGTIDFVLSYRRPAPRAVGYRTQREVTIDDLLNALRELGYAPRARTCNDLAEVVGPADGGDALVGAHLEIDVARCRGHIRVQLPDPGRARARRPAPRRARDPRRRRGRWSRSSACSPCAPSATCSTSSRPRAATRPWRRSRSRCLTSALPDRPERLG